MNFEFAERINPFLEKLDFGEALKIAEEELRKLPETDFHGILEISLIDEAEDLTEWIESFYTSAAKKTALKAMYFEMNEFDINTDLWFIDGFGYSEDGGLDLEEMDWLSDFETNTRDEINSVYVFQGLEKIQEAFVDYPTGSEEARDWCEQIIITRFMQLIRTTHLVAKDKNYKWGEIPLYFTEHAYDFIVMSK